MVDRLVCCLIDWGPGMLIAALVLYGLFKITRDVGLRIVSALEKPADALQKQAASMEKLTQSLDEYVSRDRSEHREIIILLKIIAGRLDHIEESKNGRD